MIMMATQDQAELVTPWVHFNDEVNVATCLSIFDQDCFAIGKAILKPINLPHHNLQPSVFHALKMI